MYRSTNNGKRWERVPIDDAHGMYFQLQRSGSFLLGLHYLELSISRDTGSTWVSTGIPSSAVGASDNLMVCGQWGGILFSSDSGATWECRIAGIPPKVPPYYDSSFYPTSIAVTGDTVFAALKNWVFMSSNAGKEWASAMKNWPPLPGNMPGDVKVNGGYVYVRSIGGLFRSSINDLLATAGPLGAAPGRALRLDPYPNPSDGRFTLSCASPGYRDRVSVRLFDLLGRLSMTREFNPFPAGNSSLEVDARGLVPGVYLLVLTAGSSLATGLVRIQ